MRASFLLALLLAALVATVTVRGEPQELWFPTGPPELVEPRTAAEGAQVPLMTRSEYDEFVKRSAGAAQFVPLRELPATISSDARFGASTGSIGRSGTLIVAGDEKRGYSVYADLDANGSLEEAPIAMENHGDYFTALIRAVATETRAGQTAHVPVLSRLVVVPSNGELKHAVYTATIRRGIAQVGGRKMAFALRGVGGLYDDPNNPVWIDLDGDGRGLDQPLSAEVFRLRERRFTIGRAAYEFRLDRYGRGLAVTALVKSVQQNPPPADPTPAPSFSALDIDGRSHTLNQYLGKVVLLHFWAPWCPPCRAEATILKSIDARHREAGLITLGVAPGAMDEIRAFILSEGQSWPQIDEEHEQPVHQLFQVIAYPTHLLISRSGQILLRHVGDLVETSATFENQLKRALSSDR